MTKEERQLVDALEQLVRDASPGVPSFLAKVNSVNETDYLCNVTINGGAVIEDARLRAVINSTSPMVMTPVVGSYVLITRIERTSEWVVIAFDQVDKVIWNVKDVKVNADTFKFNEGENGGIVISEKLVNYLTALEQAVSQGIAAVGIGGAANGTTGASAFESAMAGAQKDFENSKVKH